MLIGTALASLPDPRTGNAQRHDLLDMLAIALTASIRGAENCVDFADSGRDREALLRAFLELPGGMPSHDTCSPLFRLLDAAAFAACFAAFLDGLGENGPKVLAIDGKTLRRSLDRAAKRSALHVVTAFAAEARLVVGQVAAGDKESEIIAARSLPGLLDRKGVLVTGDALHGRIEVRRHRVSHDIGRLLSDRRHPDEAAKDAKRFAAAVRAHWRIENSLHRVLDVTFDEDRARNRRDHGPENLGILRKLALNVLQRARPDISVRRNRKRSGWSDEFARTVIGQMR